MGAQVVKSGKARRRGINKRSRKREERGAAELGGRRAPGSGSGVVKGDFRTDRFMVEDKVTEAKSFRVTVALIQKLVGQATRTGRTGVLRIGLPGFEIGVMLWADLAEMLHEQEDL